jgi:hypothetical protein
MLHTKNRTSTTTTAETGQHAVFVVGRIVSCYGLVAVIARIGVLKYFPCEAVDRWDGHLVRPLRHLVAMRALWPREIAKPPRRILVRPPEATLADVPSVNLHRRRVRLWQCDSGDRSAAGLAHPLRRGREPTRRAPGNPYRSADRTGPAAFTVRADQQEART